MSCRGYLVRWMVGVGLAVFWFAQGVHAQEITVTLLGTGNTGTAADRFGSSILIQAGGQVLVIDVGRGAFQRLNQAGISGAQIDAVFLTHLHSDHLVGLPELWLSGWLFAARTRPWKILGPTGTVAMAGHLQQAFSVDLNARVQENAPFLPAAGAELVASDIQPGVVFENNGVRVTAVEVDHRAIAPAFGYRVDYGGRSVVLSGDTQPVESLIKAAQGTDLLIHEVYDASEELLKNNPRTKQVQSFHTSASQAGTVFTRVHPKLAVYSHIALRGVTTRELVQRTRATYAGPLMVGDDLMRFEIGDTIAIYRP